MQLIFVINHTQALKCNTPKEHGPKYCPNVAHLHEFWNSGMDIPGATKYIKLEPNLLTIIVGCKMVPKPSK